MNDVQDTVDSAKKRTVHAYETAREGVESAKQTTMQTLTNGAAMIAKAVGATTTLVATLRKLDSDDGLAWFGLARRRSPLLTIAIFGAGAAVGAGFALLLAPTSGEELRRKLFDSLSPAKAPETTETEASADAPAASGAAPETAVPGSEAVRAAGTPPNGERAKA